MTRKYLSEATNDELYRYALSMMPSHLAEAGQLSKLVHTLISFHFLRDKIHVLGIEALIRDYELIDEDALKHIQNALHLSASALVISNSSVESQLYSRLMTREEPLVQTLIEDILQSDQPWLRPITSSLTPVSRQMLHSFSNHPSSLSAITRSPNGQWLVSADRRGRIRLWDLTQGTLVETIQLSDITMISLIIDNQMEVIGGDENGVLSWLDWRSSWHLYQIDAHSGSIDSILMLPQGHEFITCSKEDAYIRWWHKGTRAQSGELSTGEIHVRSLALASDGTTLICGGDNGTILLIDSISQELLNHWTAHEQAITDLWALHRTNRLLTISSELKLKLWELPSGNLLNTVAASARPITDQKPLIAVNPDETVVVYTGWPENTNIYVTGIDADLTSYSIPAHSWPITDLTISSDGKRLITAGQDAKINVWEFPTSTLTGSISHAHVRDVADVAVARSAPLAASCSLDGSIKIWDLTTGNVINEFIEEGVYLFNLCFSPRGQYLVSGGYPGKLTLWDIERRTRNHSFLGFNESPTHFVPTPDFAKLLSTGSRELTLWELHTGQILNQLSFRGAVVSQLAMTAQGDKSIVAFSDYSICVMDHEQGRLIHELVGHHERVSRLLPLQDEDHVISTSYDGTMILWDIQSGKRLHTFVGHQDNIQDAAMITGNPLRVISAASNGELIVWNIEEKKEAFRLMGHSDTVYNIGVSPNGGTAATVSFDETTILWDLHKAKLVTRFAEEHRPIKCVFSANPEVLIIGEMGGTVHLLVLENRAS